MISGLWKKLFGGAPVIEAPKSSISVRTVGNPSRLASPPTTKIDTSADPLEQSLGEIFTIAAKGPLAADDFVLDTLTDIDDSDLSDNEKKSLFNAIIDHMPVSTRIDAALHLYEYTDDEWIENYTIDKSLDAIAGLPPEQRCAQAVKFLESVNLPNASCVHRITGFIDDLPPAQRYQGANDIMEEIDEEYEDIIVEKAIEVVKFLPPEQRYQAMLDLYDYTDDDSVLEKKIVEDALRSVDDLPVMDRFTAAIDIVDHTNDESVKRLAYETALKHASAPTYENINNLTSLIGQLGKNHALTPQAKSQLAELECGTIAPMSASQFTQRMGFIVPTP